MRALASESIGCSCATFGSDETGSPPTRCVGESGVTSSGCVGLDRAQLVEQRVVVVVADLGVVEDVVAVAVVVQLARAAPRRAAAASVAAGALTRPPLRAGASSRARSCASSASMPVDVGEVEVQRRDRDAAGGDRGEVRPGLVVEAGVARRRSSSGGGPSLRRSVELQLVAVDALAQPRDLDAVRLAGRGS